MDTFDPVVAYLVDNVSGRRVSVYASLTSPRPEYYATVKGKRRYGGTVNSVKTIVSRVLSWERRRVLTIWKDLK